MFTLEIETWHGTTHSLPLQAGPEDATLTPAQAVERIAGQANTIASQGGKFISIADYAIPLEGISRMRVIKQTA